MSLASWYLLIGALLFFMALSASTLKRLPLTTAIVYLAVGVLVGPSIGQNFHISPIKHSAILEIVTEAAVLISLFSAGLKLQAGFRNPLWRIPLRLATLSMLITVGLVSLLGVSLLDLPLGAAILLGAIVAPTDPVLATDVQVTGHTDHDRLRFSLTGEASMNDGTAFPFVMLGLGLLGMHEIGSLGWQWLVVDFAWASAAGVGIGVACGALTALMVDQLKHRGIHSEFMDDFLGLGLIALTYGLSLSLKGYGFLSVFFAAYTLRQVEFWLSHPRGHQAIDELIADGEYDDRFVVQRVRRGYMSEVSLFFNEQLERLAEVLLILLIGGMLFMDSWKLEYIIFALALFFLVRPLAVALGTRGMGIPGQPLALMSWFGVRGIGSFYYLMYAIQHGLPEPLAVIMVSVVLVVVTLSIVLHGISVTPLMNAYSKRQPDWVITT